MRIVATFDPSTKTSDTFNAGFSGGVGKLVIYNESNVNLQLAWEAFTTYCPAWTAMLYCVSTNNINIDWQQQSTLAASGPPLSQVLVEAYDPGEPVVGTFPAALVRNVNVGNTVNTVGGAANSIQNDNNSPGTVFVEATASGDGASGVSLTNTGILTLGNATHHGSLSTDNTKVSTDGAGNLTVAGTNGIIVSGGKLGISSAGDLIDRVTVPTELHIITSGGDIVFYSPAGTEVGRITNAGMIEAKGAINAEGIVNGSTSGTAVLYQIFGHAHYKLVIVEVSGSWNSTLKTLSIGTAFTTRAQVRALDNAPPMRFLNSGVAVGMDLVTGFTAGGVRVFTSVTSIAASGFMGAIKSAFDTVELSATGTVGPATIIIEGY